MMKISGSQNKRTQVASDKTDEASKIGQLSKGAGRQTVGVVRTGDRFEIAKNPSVFDQLTGGNGRAPLWGQGVERPARDPNHAADGVRHDHPAVNPSLDGNDPRGDLDRGSLERETVVDVTTTTPGGHSLEQSLPTGLDGKPIRTGPHHQINDLGDKFLDGRSSDSNSPGNMQRDPLGAGKGTGSSGAQQGGGWGGDAERTAWKSGGGDATKDTLGRDSGSGAGGEMKAGGGTQGTPPPGAELSFRAPKNDLVGLKDYVPPAGSDEKAAKLAKAEQEKRDKAAEQKEAQERFKKRDFDKDNMTDPDAGAATTLTEEQLVRAIAVHGGDTKPVEGHGAGPQIEGDAPMIRNGDLVKNPNPEDAGTFDVSTGTTTPPGLEISKTLNPRDGLGSALPPSPGPGTGGGGAGNPIDA